MENINGLNTLITISITVVVIFFTAVIALGVPILILYSLMRRSSNSTSSVVQMPLRLDPVAATDAEVLEHLENHRKINAIKRYRELTGVGLKEAKDAVDYLERNPDAVIEKRTSRLSTESAGSTSGTPFDSGIRDLIRQNKSHEALKVYQEFTGASLSEAAVEIERLTWEIEEQAKRAAGSAGGSA
jgi:ribosomal protein L7/L12